LLSVLVFFAVVASSAATQTGASPPDYAQRAHWICFPGNEASCTNGLDAVAVAADGTGKIRKFTSLPDPPIDCFYVYPTVSEEPTAYSDMALTPELTEVARTQAGRLASHCSLFAPIYRQLTAAGLSAVLAAHGTPDWTGPYTDVRAAWRWYMAHENNGRGVILIGHSQGTILLQRLLQEQIDGQPDQKKLVAAFLAGDPALPVEKHATLGGIFKHIPLCSDSNEVGCVYVWSSYLADDNSSNRVFGHNPPGAMVAGCVNPAKPEGGAGELKAYFHKPSSASVSDPPWIVAEGQLSAECVADAQGNVLRITVLPTKFAAQITDELRKGADGDPGGWGLHALDLDLTQGNVLDRVAQEAATWLHQHTAPAH